MKDKLKQYLNKAFASYGEFPAKQDVMEELLTDLYEKYNDLKQEGKSDDEAYQQIIDSLGNVDEIMKNIPHSEANKKSESNLGEFIDDIASWIGITKEQRFNYTTLAKSDLDGVDLRGETFYGSDLQGSSFKESILIAAKFKAAALKGANFNGANLSNAVFNASDLQNVQFDNANLTNAELRGSNLKGSSFKNAILVCTDFGQSDLQNVSFDNQTLTGAIFNSASLKNTSFKNAILNDVSFKYSAIKHAIFDGSTMDKITYAILNGAKATLNNVKVV